MSIVLETTIGDITIDLYTKERPITCKNFLKLCKMKYYNYHLFHSIQQNFLAQTGDPTGTGKGGESIFGLINGPSERYYSCETQPVLRHTTPGLVSMVNCGDGMLGSQFFVTLGHLLDSLDEHVVFGVCVEGLDTLLAFNEVICDINNRPYKDVRITHTVILFDPYEDISGMNVPALSPPPSGDILKTDRIAADEEIDENEGCSMAEIEEIKAEQEAEAQATILEIVGDIPDKDIAPPENVLFVCKLNPVTNDDDLEIIFSRFGQVKSCEVIRDKISGDSLQYAFVEFAETKSCEEAYLKMDNVLIDDRRIHVDFSQSVAKLRWRGKGKGVIHLDEKKNGDEKAKRRDRRHNSPSNKEDYKHRTRENPEKSRNDKYGSNYRERQRTDERKRRSSYVRDDRERRKERREDIDRKRHRNDDREKYRGGKLEGYDHERHRRSRTEQERHRRDQQDRRRK